MLDNKLLSTYSIYSKKRSKLLKARRYRQIDYDTELEAYNRMERMLNARGDITPEETDFMASWMRVLNLYGSRLEPLP